MFVLILWLHPDPFIIVLNVDCFFSGFYKDKWNYDVGIIRLSEDVPAIGSVVPACVPANLNMLSLVGQIGIGSGWGKTGEYFRTSYRLKYIKMRVLEDVECQRIRDIHNGSHYNISMPNIFCAMGNEYMQTLREGDSGGNFDF